MLTVATSRQCTRNQLTNHHSKCLGTGIELLHSDLPTSGLWCCSAKERLHSENLHE